MSISPKDVKTLREKTGAGMMDCKNALKDSDGDMEKAIDLLRQKGLAGVQKRAGRTAAEGLVVCNTQGNKALMVEVNCETDFVSKNDDFRAFAEDVAKHLVAQNQYENKSIDDAHDKLANDSWYSASDRKFSDIIAEKMSVVGENIRVRRFTSYVAAEGGIATYIHGGGRIGVMVEYKTDKDSPEVNSVVRDVAMHIAAINPSYLDRSSVTEEDLKREEAIYRQQVLDQGKPEKIVDKIVQGKMSKFYSEVCLLEQEFVKEAKVPVKKFLEEQSKKLGSQISIARYSRYHVGEGLE